MQFPISIRRRSEPDVPHWCGLLFVNTCFSDVRIGDEPTLHAAVVVMEPSVEDRDGVENKQIPKTSAI